MRKNIQQTIRERIQSRVGNTARAGSWYDIRNKDGDVAEIRIYEEIHWFWGIGAEEFAQELDEITAPEILCMINSPGGDVFDGVAIYNALRAHPAKVTTRVDGIAASVASVIAQAGDHRVMLTGAQMMIHEAWGLVIGDAGDMREYADLLDRQNDNIAGIYGRRADKDQAHFRELMMSDKWFNADETVDEGLADEVVDLPPNADKATDKSRNTLHDELTETIGVVEETLVSAERVAALRAEHGERLSEKNRATLGELAQRLSALLDATEAEQVDDGDEPAPGVDKSNEAAQQELLKFLAGSHS